MSHSKEKTSGRRAFLKAIGAAGAVAGTLPLGAVSAATEKPMLEHQHSAPGAASDAPPPAGYTFFNFFEAQFLEAAVDTIIPSDETGPGALELGVATYIDRQMTGGYGKGARLYLQGPFAEGTPQQGYQLPLNPSELMRAGIADLEAYVQKKHGLNFAALSPADRKSVLQAVDTNKLEIDGNKVEFATVPPDVFFGRLLQLVMEGYFGDPMYGGNRGKGSWKMIGFPGVGGMYSAPN